MRVQHSRNKTGRLLGRVILVAVLAAVVALALTVFFRNQPERQSAELAYPFSFQADDGAFSARTLNTAAPLSENLVVCEASVNAGAVRLSRETESALLFDLEKREALYANQIYEQRFPASLTKIMTAILVLEYADMNDVITITQEDLLLEERAQVSGLYAGESLSVEQLLNALLVYSANDAASALARKVGGTTEKFVSMMNEQARQLGMTATHFTNPHGLHSDELYTTAYDVYLMMQEAYRHEMFSTISRRASCQLTPVDAAGTSRTITLYATDLFLSGVVEMPTDLTIVASKTGSTGLAGYCLCLVVLDSQGVPYMVEVMNAPSQDELYRDMNLLLQKIKDP